MPIDVNAAAQKYAAVTPAMAQIWQQRASAAAQKWEQNAKSMEAEQYWAQRVVEAAQQQARLRGLQAVSAQDYAQGIQVGANVYREKVSTIAPQRWARKFAPFAQVIDQVVASLPPKTTDVVQNVLNRVAPIAQALRQAKLAGVVAPTGMGTPTPTPAPAPGLRAPFLRR